MKSNGKSDWENSFAIISAPKGIRLISFADVSNAQLQSNMVKASEAITPDSQWNTFASDGDMPTNNWKENSDGQDYIQRASAEGRPDVLGWAATVLAPRIQAVFADFSKRYKWGEPGNLSSIFGQAATQSNTEALDAPRLSARETDAAPPADRATKILDAAAITGKGRLDVFKYVKSGVLT